MKKTLYAIALSSVLLSGCSMPIKPMQETHSTSVNYPPIGKIVSKSLGESLVISGVKTIGEAIEVAEGTQVILDRFGTNTCRLIPHPGTYFKIGNYSRSDIRGTCYSHTPYYYAYGDGSSDFYCNGSSQAGVGNICKRPGGSYFLAISMYGVFGIKTTRGSINTITAEVGKKNDHVQEFIYNGKFGNNLKFIYREFSKDLARPAFTQEVQYDIAESQEIGFKNLRIDVLDASNTKITYKLLSNF